ncbi:MAG: hypothetical protein AB7C89_06135 [Intestinibacillus sp.]
MHKLRFSAGLATLMLAASLFLSGCAPQPTEDTASTGSEQAPASSGAGTLTSPDELV